MTIEHIKATIRGIDVLKSKGAGSNIKSIIKHRKVAAGASADAKYVEGVLVITMAKGGLMYEATVGGQKFKFEPLQ